MSWGEKKSFIQICEPAISRFVKNAEHQWIKKNEDLRKDYKKLHIERMNPGCQIFTRFTKMFKLQRERICIYIKANYSNCPYPPHDE